MASWKKMAEAFGKAANRPGATSGGRDIVYNSKTWKDRPGDVNPRYDDTPEQRGMKEGWQKGRDEYYGARELADEKGLDRNDPKVLENMADEISDANSDAALKANREKEWDDAFKRSIDKFKSQSSALTDEDADVWRSELLRTIDVLRKRGFSDADILNTIKGN